jgi:hypothetical protein
MNANQTIQRLVTHALVAGVICFGLMQLVGALAINPGVGEGFGIAPDSFRYRLGLWFEAYGVVFAVLACWPMMVVDSFGLHSTSPWLWCLGFLVAGGGWVLLWHFGSRQFHQIRRASGHDSGGKLWA